MKLIIQSAQVVSSQSITEQTIFVKDGRIVAAFPEEEADRIIDAKGKYLLPGAIDAHVHFREPGASHKETWETGSKAAVIGGVTTVLDMPNNNPPVIDAASLEAKRELILGRSHVNYGFHFGATGNVEAMKEAEGITGVKVYMGSSTGDLLVDEPTVWEKIFEAAKEKDIPVIVHAENEQRIKERSREMASDRAPIAHAKIRDCQCAKIAVDAAVALREKVGNRLHIAHMSCAEELDCVRAHEHPHLSCEVAPHHLYFSMDDMKDAYLKMNPPLRHEEDLRALWEGLRDGSVNCVATDHAPHTKEEKEVSDPLSAPSGVPGVGFVLPLLLNEVSEKMLTLQDVVRLLCEEPARIFRLKGKGFIEEGMHADLTLVDMEVTKTIDTSLIHTKCGWSPYEGYTLKGWPVLTLVHGQVAHENGSLVGEPFGKEVEVSSAAKPLNSSFS